MSNPVPPPKLKSDRFINRYNRVTAFPTPTPDSSGIYKCIPCEKLFNNMESYSAHSSTHTNCSYSGCGYQASAKAVAKHYRAMHGEFVEARDKAEEMNIATTAPTEITKYFCAVCVKVAYSVEAWNSHLLAHIKCNLCSFSASKKVVENHSLEVHNTPHIILCESINEGDDSGQYECAPCSISFNQLGSYNTHSSRHLKCSFDGCDFIAGPKVVAKHFIDDHNKIMDTKVDMSGNEAPNKHHCIPCNKVVYSASAFAAHLATHTNCPVCGYEAASHLVEKHQVVHTVASLEGKFQSVQDSNQHDPNIEILNKKAMINSTPEWMTQGHFILDGLPPAIVAMAKRLYPPFMIFQNEAETLGKRKLEIDGENKEEQKLMKKE